MKNQNRELPKSWRRARLDEIARVVGGSTPDTGNQEYWDGDIVWITPADLGQLNDRRIRTSGRKISREGYENSGTEMLPSGSVVLSSRAPIGYLGIATRPLCTNQGCKSFIPSKGIDSEYLYWRILYAVPELKELGSGATFAEVSKSSLEAFEISFPPISEQKRIAGILNERMAARDKARAVIEAQLSVAEALPVAYLRQVFPKEGLPLPPGWEWAKMGEVCAIQLGKMLSPKSKLGINSFPYLRNANIQWNRVDTTDVACMDFCKAEQEKFRLKEGDLLICEGGEPGRSAIWDGRIDPCFYQKSLHRLRPIKNLVDPQFALFRMWIGVLRGEFISANVKTTIAHLPAIRLESLAIPLPSISEQKRLVAILNEQMAYAKRLESTLNRQLSEIDALPQALLRQAFNGEL